MEDLFVKYETAINLRDLGFNKPCIAFWNIYREVKLNTNSDSVDKYLKAPLIQQVNDWILEEFGINITLRRSVPTFIMKTQDSEKKEEKWYAEIYLPDKPHPIKTAHTIGNRQKCLEVAIDYFIYEKFKEKKLTHY